VSRNATARTCLVVCEAYWEAPPDCLFRRRRGCGCGSANRRVIEIDELSNVLAATAASRLDRPRSTLGRNNVVHTHALGNVRCAVGKVGSR
jgi:hypothetical protein